MDVRAKAATLFALKNTESVINKQPKRLSEQARRNQKTLFAPRICPRMLAPTTVRGQSRWNFTSNWIWIVPPSGILKYYAAMGRWIMLFPEISSSRQTWLFIHYTMPYRNYLAGRTNTCIIMSFPKESSMNWQREVFQDGAAWQASIFGFRAKKWMISFGMMTMSQTWAWNLGFGANTRGLIITAAWAIITMKTRNRFWHWSVSFLLFKSNLLSRSSWKTVGSLRQVSLKLCLSRMPPWRSFVTALILEEI